jgi:hypothetical protein
MQAIRCPKCVTHEKLYNTPLGKIVRNPYADLTLAVHDTCNACDGTGYVPTAVVDSIVRFARDETRAAAYLSALRWSMDHFSFDACGMYVGVETDGYLHT